MYKAFSEISPTLAMRKVCESIETTHCSHANDVIYVIVGDIMHEVGIKRMISLSSLSLYVSLCL